MINLIAFKRNSSWERTVMLILLALLFSTTNIFAQGLIKGAIKDATGNTLPGDLVSDKCSCNCVVVDKYEKYTILSKNKRTDSWKHSFYIPEVLLC